MRLGATPEPVAAPPEVEFDEVTKWVGAVVHVEHCGLATLEQQGLAGVERVIQNEACVGNHGPESVSVRQQVFDDLFDLNGATVVNLDEQVVLLVQCTLDLLSQNVFVEKILNADADAVDLVGVRRPNSPTGRTDLALAEKALGDLVERAVVLGDDVRVGRNEKSRDVNAAGLERCQLVEKHFNVNDDTIGDDGRHPWGEDARRQQVQGVFFVTDNNCVARVVSAVELDDVVDAAAEKVGCLAFALVAPLGSDDDDCWHELSPPAGYGVMGGGLHPILS